MAGRHRASRVRTVRRHRRVGRALTPLNRDQPTRDAGADAGSGQRASRAPGGGTARSLSPSCCRQARCRCRHWRPPLRQSPFVIRRWPRRHRALRRSPSPLHCLPRPQRSILCSIPTRHRRRQSRWPSPTHCPNRGSSLNLWRSRRRQRRHSLIGFLHHFRLSQLSAPKRPARTSPARSPARRRRGRPLLRRHSASAADHELRLGLYRSRAQHRAVSIRQGSRRPERYLCTGLRRRHGQ